MRKPAPKYRQCTCGVVFDSPNRLIQHTLLMGTFAKVYTAEELTKMPKHEVMAWYTPPTPTQK